MSSSPSSTSATTSSTSSSSTTTTWRRLIKPYDAHGAQSSGVRGWHTMFLAFGRRRPRTRCVHPHRHWVDITTGWTADTEGSESITVDSLSLDQNPMTRAGLESTVNKVYGLVTVNSVV
jgi:hypothetical protein